MQETLTDPKADAQRLRRAFHLALGFVAGLWLLKLTELALGFSLGEYGVYPQRLSALGGILCGPLIHGSFAHLFANTAPVIILGAALLYGYPKSAARVLALIWLGSGLGVWLFAREAYHIGASGLSFGMMFFVFTIGILRWEKRAIALALIVFFLYGGMIWGIFPSKPEISFESHFFGALIGVISAFVFRNTDPAPPRKKYSWEEEAQDEANGDSGSYEPWNHR